MTNLRLFLVLSFLLVGLNQTTYGQNLKVEPPNWWFGMKEPSLQLMAHYPNISEMTLELKDSDSLGLILSSVEPAESPDYLFINLNISAMRKAGNVEFVFTPSSGNPLSLSYTFYDRDFEASELMGFDASDVIYLITPDRFSNGDPSNDTFEFLREKGVAREHDYARHGGDIKGIINHLPYLDSLGVTAIWSSPLLENNMERWSYHGYAITDFYQVDPRFGTLADYKMLATEMRKREMKLIFDGVVNHCGLHHWWIEKPPFKDWLNYQSEPQQTNHRRTVHMDPYASEKDRERMLGGWFVETMPDLNQSNPYMAKYLIQNSIWWIEFLSLGGVRQDTYPYSYKSFLSDWSCAIMNEYPNFSIVGEEWSYNPMVVAYWQQGKSKETASCLPSVMDFPMQEGLIKALTEKESWDKGLIRLYEGLANDFVYEDPTKLMIFLDNHDMDRVFTQLNHDYGLFKMAFAYLMTQRGIPQMYYGTELLLENSDNKGSHGHIRTDFPGGWSGDAASAQSPASLSQQSQSSIEYCRELLNWRKTKTVIHNGRTMHFAPAKDSYVYFRYDKEEGVMVVLNKGDEYNLDLSRFDELLSNWTAVKEWDAKEWAALNGELRIKQGENIFELR